MSEHRKGTKQTRPSGTLPSADLKIGAVREVKVTYVAQPPHVPKEQEIHPRREIPALPVEPAPPPAPKRREG